MSYRSVRMLALAAGLSVAGSACAEPRAVIELFTSQGCSSCPAADRLLGELAKDPSLVTLTLAVDYWDYLGWKDTLALRGHAERQRAYAGVRQDRQVYTPQVVVNGATHVLGSDKDAIESAVAQTRREATPLTVNVAVTVADGSVSVVVPASAKGGKGEIWLCPMTKKVPVTIERGENKGATLTYHNVVRRWVKLGEWTGQTQKFTLPVKDFTTAESDAVAVVVQSGGREAPGMMIGAAVASLN